MPKLAGDAAPDPGMRVRDLGERAFLDSRNDRPCFARAHRRAPLRGGIDHAHLADVLSRPSARDDPAVDLDVDLADQKQDEIVVTPALRDDGVALRVLGDGGPP